MHNYSYRRVNIDLMRNIVVLDWSTKQLSCYLVFSPPIYILFLEVSYWGSLGRVRLVLKHLDADSLIFERLVAREDHIVKSAGQLGL